MPKIYTLSIILITLIATPLQSQETAYFVHFTDKIGTPHTVEQPQTYLSQRAIDRRIKYNIAVEHSDLPNSPQYITSLYKHGATRVISLKWLQGAVIHIPSDSLNTLKNLHFIDSIEHLNAVTSLEPKSVTQGITSKPSNHHSDALKQIEQINLLPLHNNGLTGTGIHIAVIDAGFLMVDEVEAYSKLRDENRILSTKDFFNPNSDIYSEHMHGAVVLSTIAAVYENQIVGTAPDASFHLIRSETYDHELPSEMYYWSAAAEYADSVGADIITSSLGYTQFDDTTKNLTHDDLDGNTAPCSRSAQMAVEKGIATIISAGNDGNNQWRKICVPADAKDVLSVGAVDIDNNRAPFSSLGNSADGRIKPDIMTRGKEAAVIKTNGEIGTANGTSFACPIAAGMVACIMQAAPHIPPMQLFDIIRNHSSQHASPDSINGYGIPNADAILRYINTPTSNHSTSANDWALFQNPITDTFSIINAPHTLHYNIINQQAQILQSGRIEPMQQINSTQLSNGIYILHLHHNNQHQHLKLIKN